MAQEKEYFAFISYKREDEKWADRLRNKLEHYRLPSSVRKQNLSLPKEIRPIFRDALELAGGVLAKEIEIALQNSKFLIVICSPNSAKSPWVNKEIQTFIDLGREDRIIPFIIDGTPFSDDEETECFPPALRSLEGEKELLGININEMGRDAASIKVVARMFGLKFDTLWQRYEREQRRKRWMWIWFAFLLVILGLSISGYFFKQNMIIEKQKSNLENYANRLREDSVKLTNHMLRIQSDSILLYKRADSIKLANTKLEDAFATILSVNTDLINSQTEIICNLSIELLNQGMPTKARITLCNFLKTNQSRVPYNSQLEFVLRQLFFLQHGIGKRLLDRIIIQNYEDFVYNAATRVLFYYDNCFYIDYNCDLWEYNTMNQHFSKVFEGDGYIEDLEGGIELYSPKYKKIFIELPEGELAMVHLPSKKMIKIHDRFRRIYINNSMSLLLINGMDNDDNYYLWDIAKDTWISDVNAENGYRITPISGDYIELTKDSMAPIGFYSHQNYDLKANYSPTNSSVNQEYELQLNNGTNELSIYIGKDDSTTTESTKKDGWYHFKELQWDIQKYRKYMSEFPMINLPSQIRASNYMISPKKKFALIEGNRSTIFLFNLEKQRVVKRISDYDIYALSIKSLAWNKNDKYLGFSVFSEDENMYTIFVIETLGGNLIMKFQSNCPDFSFSNDGTQILIQDKKVPFPSYTFLVNYFSRMN